VRQYVLMPLLPLEFLRWRWKVLRADWTKYTSLSIHAFEETGLIRDLREYGYDSGLQLGRTVAEDEARDLGRSLEDGGRLSSDPHELKTGIKTRYPLLDVALLEAALSVPFDLKKNGSQKRALARAAARDFLPMQIAERRDKGHGNPNFRARLAECEQRLRAGFSEFRSNEVWRYLVDIDKTLSALSYLRHPSVSEEVDVKLNNQVCRPYELGCFLMAMDARPIKGS
jgi:hypothetical protein